MTRIPHSFGLLILAVILFGCGGSLTVTSFLDVERLERTNADGITAQTGTNVESVACPDEVAMEAGNVFECTVTDESGNTAIVTVTQDDDVGNMTWELPEDTLLDIARVEEVISEGIADQLGVVTASVECPDEVLIEAGNDFECTVTDDQGNTDVVAVTQVDDAGNISWELGQ